MESKTIPKLTIACLLLASFAAADECQIQYDDVKNTEGLLMTMVICVAISQVAIILMMAVGVLPGMRGRRNAMLVSKLPHKKPVSNV